MSKLWLRYKNIGDGSYTDLSFDAAVNRDEPTVSRETVESLRYIIYSRKKSERSVVTVVIGADQLVVAANFTHVKAWWTADERLMSLVTTPTVDADYDEVDAGDGLLPVSYVENNKHFPEVSFTLTASVPE